MKKIYIIGVIVIVVVFGGLFFIKEQGLSLNDSKIKTALQGQEIVVYKTKTCGCCHIYTRYLDKENTNVKVVDVDDLSVIKNQYDVPSNLESCHTSLVGGYVVEGHIPLEVIEKLLAEKPPIKGIALPGMPSGSPGMPGPKMEEWVIYAIGNDGQVSEFMNY